MHSHERLLVYICSLSVCVCVCVSFYFSVCVCVCVCLSFYLFCVSSVSQLLFNQPIIPCFLWLRLRPPNAFGSVRSGTIYTPDDARPDAPPAESKHRRLSRIIYC